MLYFISNKGRFASIIGINPNRYLYTFASPLSSLFTFPCNTFDCFGLNEKDYANLKWEDEPVEVFINMED